MGFTSVNQPNRNGYSNYIDLDHAQQSRGDAGDRKRKIGMGRLLYEKSVSDRGHLIIPFVYGMADGKPICSYRLLSAQGYQGRFHQAENPAGIYADQVECILEIAQEHLDQCLPVERSQTDYFRQRYTYRDHLIIVHPETNRVFYDHYSPDKLNNIAAPKLFASEAECIEWVKQGIDQLHTPPARKSVGA